LTDPARIGIGQAIGIEEENCTVEQVCSCPCPASPISVREEAIGRLFCHCTVCQEVYKKPYADVTYFWACSISLPKHDIQLRHYRPPPALNRGVCAKCGSPVVAFMAFSPASVVAFVPSQNFERQADLPTASRHIFYHRRVADIADAVSKITGYCQARDMFFGTIFSQPFRTRVGR
jgi:hypothetical protein